MIGSRFDKGQFLNFDDRVDPASTALVVIDVQNDFALPQGVCGQVGDDISPVEPMVQRLKALIEEARKAGLFIVFVRTIYDEPVLSPSLTEQYIRRGYPNSICLTGTPGAEFYGGIGPRPVPNEVLVTKHRYSAFWGSPIDLVLRENGIRTVVLTGIATEVCVESTARDAFFMDYQVVVAEDCCGSYSEERQKAALTVMARSFGVVTTADKIADVWRRRGNGPRNWQPDMRAARALTDDESKLRPQHTALVLVNLQNRFYDSGVASRDTVMTAAKSLLDRARQAGCLIVHVRAASGGDVVPGFEAQGDEQTVMARRLGAFTETQLEVLLRSNCIRTVVFAGATTNGAVEATARAAADRDYHVFIAEDCVAASALELELHKASLVNMSRYVGTVMPGAAIAAFWPEAPTGKAIAYGRIAS